MFNLAFAILLILVAFPAAASELPDNGVVVGGAASISSTGSQMTVSQSTNRAIISWDSFNIVDAAVTFSQPNSSSIALNRVGSGVGPSTINGILNANGHVMVLNPNGSWC